MVARAAFAGMLLLAVMSGCADGEPKGEDDAGQDPAAPEGSVTSIPWSYSPAGTTLGCPQACVSLNANGADPIRAPKGGHIVGLAMTLTEETAVEAGKPFHVTVHCLVGTRACPSGGVVAKADGPSPLAFGADHLALPDNATLRVDVVWERVTPPTANAVGEAAGQRLDTYSVAGSIEAWVPKKADTREF